MATETELKLNGLVLSAAELRQLTDWPDALIEDYLNILRNLVILSNEIDIKNDILKLTTVVTTTPYAPDDGDEEIAVNTTAQPITITLPIGEAGRNYRIINIGTSGNNVTIIPNGSEYLFGVNGNETIYDQEAFIITYFAGEGWW